MLVGMVAGATAVLFSDKKNRQKASQIVAKSKSRLKRLSVEAKKDPEAFAKRMGKKVAKEARKINNKISSDSKKS